jgi:hypothetical protein
MGISSDGNAYLQVNLVLALFLFSPPLEIIVPFSYLLFAKSL